MTFLIPSEHPTNSDSVDPVVFIFCLEDSAYTCPPPREMTIPVLDLLPTSVEKLKSINEKIVFVQVVDSPIPYLR